MTTLDEDVPYAELHAHTNFSLLDGSSDPEAMVKQAKALGLAALAVTDHDSLAGIVRFAAAAKHQDLPAVIGAELTLEEESEGAGRPERVEGPARSRPEPVETHLVVLVKDLRGYQNLCRLLTLAYRDGDKDRPRLRFDDLASRADGLIALSGCPQGALPQALARGGHAAALAAAARYRDLFGPENYYVELANHHLQADGARNAGLAAVARDLGLRCVATNDAHYHDSSRALLHHVVTCIRHGATLESAGTLLRPNDEYLLKSPAQMARLFRRERAAALEARRPDLDPIRTSVEIAQRCAFTLKDLEYQFPKAYVPDDETDYSFLVRLVEAGKQLFYPNASREVEDRLQNELAIVEHMKLAGYLLVFKEVVDWSREHDILCSIRGSAPASALLYCLGLCPIDPVKHGLLFERFCSPERNEYPDIDLDFAHERREEVIQHVYRKYGRDHAAMVCEVNTYRTKSALRDVAKVLGLSAQRAQQLADQVDWYDPDPAERLLSGFDRVPRHGAAPRDHARATARSAASSPAAHGGHDRLSPWERRVNARAGGEEAQRAGPWAKAGEGSTQVPEPPDPDRISGRMATLLLDLAKQLQHSPRHHSIHVGGMVISAGPLAHVVPTMPARMPERTIIPWDKDDITLLAEEFGIQLIKMDLLGLGMLSLIGRCFEFVRERTGQQLFLHGFQYDKRVYDVLSAGDTVGLFQVESRAQQSFLPRLKPENLGEVAISVGAIRPGPGAARAGEHIVRRRQGKERISYPAPGLEGVLGETYGVLLWQEQCIQVAVICAGYTPGEGDQLRRAMSHKRSVERMSELCADVVRRMLERGHSPEVAENVRKMIVGFAGYGFPRAHAYPFAHLALISATLRLRYPAAYYAALLNAQPMGFYAPHTVIWDAHRHHVRVLPVDANRSEWECTLEDGPASGGVQSATGKMQSGPPEPAIRLGFKEVTGLGAAARVILERERARGPFRSVADFVARTGFDRETLERLAEVGAFLDLPGGHERRAAIWATGELAGFTEGHLPGVAEQVALDAGLPAMSEWEALQADYRGIGYSIGRHVVSYFRPNLQRQRALTAVELNVKPRGLVVRAGGLVIVRQRPETASHLVFLTLEDETGLLNAIVYPQTYERLRRVLRGEPLIVIEGPLHKQDTVTHIMVRRAWPLVQDPRVPRVPSHDFH